MNKAVLVQVKDIHKYFEMGGKTLKVLTGISFEIFTNEILTIVGASGVGKSTLLHIIGTLDFPTQGEVLFENVNVFQMNDTKLSRFRNTRIGFIFQFYHLLPEFTALENVMMPALINRMGRNAAAKRATELLTLVGLESRINHRPGELSGGEQQRVAMARSLILKPSILLADEPTGNLDQKTGEEIQNLLFLIKEKEDISIVVVTHNYDLARKIDRKLLLEHGNIKEVDKIP